jgi:release factor glutamine methyltransferase
MTQTQEWTVGRLLQWTTDYLTEKGVDGARLDAEVLLAEARDCARIDLYAAYTEPADDETRTAFRELVRRRAEGTPVAYLVGRREFYSLDFRVSPDVLIPRPETELLVVAALDGIKAHGPAGPVAICDVGTGSGILAVCIAKHCPRAKATAIDISTAALDIARQNAETHQVIDRIEFLKSDLLAELPADVKFDCIVSNPPYVSTAEMCELAPEVAKQEPHAALHAGERGTEVIERLLPQAALHLERGGELLIEISPMILAPVEQLVEESTDFELQGVIKDLAGLARVVHLTRK